jgi:ribosomal protein S18 acetylase RimI-like enzyme
MVASAQVAFSNAPNPHIRQIDPWRDGRMVASLLENAFRDEIIDESGARMLSQLRNYGVFEALSFGFGTGFVWVEDDEIVGNASVQRNLMRRDTWMIGNVATRADMRNRGIGRALVDKCVDYAVGKGARYVALQADINNKPALHVYGKAGFARMGEVMHYQRNNARQVARQSIPSAHTDVHIRPARWMDANAVWALTQHNIPAELTFADAFDSNVYRLGVRWSLANTFAGNPEHWFVLPTPANPKALLGAVRTRANIDGACHHLEVLLSNDAAANTETGVRLIACGLERLANYISNPVYAAQALPHPAVHHALVAMDFQPRRTLTHMRLTVGQ